MAFDASRDVTVLFGSGETWEWDGVSWTRRFPSASPSDRWGNAIAYDSVREKIVLFGGMIGDESLSDTWTWDGTDWAELVTIRTPSPRAHHGMTFDEGCGRMIVYGGSTETDPNGTAETWELGLPVQVTSVSPSTGSELGDNLINVYGSGFTEAADSIVTIGGTPAEITDVTCSRMQLRTQPGTGTVDVAVSNATGMSSRAGAYTYVDSVIAGRLGNVNVAQGDREDVLLVNGTAGDPARVVYAGLGEPITLEMLAPSSRTSSRFVLYVWAGESDAASLTSLSHDLGWMSFPPPFRGGRPIRITNQFGYDATLGASDFPSSPAPSTIGTHPGYPQPRTFTLQGLIRDNGARVPEGVSVTNAVILKVE